VTNKEGKKSCEQPNEKTGEEMKQRQPEVAGRAGKNWVDAKGPEKLG